MSESVCVSGRDLVEKHVGGRGEEGSGARSDWRLCQGAPRNLDGRFGDIDEHSNRIRINDALERLNREISRRTKVVGNFSDGQSALKLVATTRWGKMRHRGKYRIDNLNPTNQGSNS